MKHISWIYSTTVLKNSRLILRMLWLFFATSQISGYTQKQVKWLSLSSNQADSSWLFCNTYMQPHKIIQEPAMISKAACRSAWCSERWIRLAWPKLAHLHKKAAPTLLILDQISNYLTVSTTDMLWIMSNFCFAAALCVGWQIWPDLLVCLTYMAQYLFIAVCKIDGGCEFCATILPFHCIAYNSHKTTCIDLCCIQDFFLSVIWRLLSEQIWYIMPWSL
jgi:hypothetical protein